MVPTTSKSKKKTSKKKESFKGESSRLVLIFSVEELNDPDPKMCSHKDCSLSACSKWEWGGGETYLCLDCQLK